MRNDVITPAPGQFFFFGSGQKINPICFVNPLRKNHSFIKKCRGLHQKSPTMSEIHQTIS